MGLQSDPFDHHLVHFILVPVVGNHYLDINRQQNIWQVLLLFLNHPYHVIGIHSPVIATEPSTPFRLLLELGQSLIFPLFRQPFLLFLRAFRVLPPHFIRQNALLLLLLLLKLLLFLNDLSLDLLVLQLLLLLQLYEVVLKCIHQCLNVLIWPQLPSVPYLLPA